MVPVIDKLLLLTIFQRSVQVGTGVYRVPSRCRILRWRNISSYCRVPCRRGVRMTNWLRLLCFGVAESNCRKLNWNSAGAIHLKSTTGWPEGVVYSVDTPCSALAFVSETIRQRPMMNPIVYPVTYLQMVQRDLGFSEWYCGTASS